MIRTADVPAAFARLADPFAAVVDRVPDTQWDAPSPCEGWTARDVLAHVVASQRGFLAERGIEGASPTGTDTDTDARLVTDPAVAWHAHDAWVRSLLADPDVAGTQFEGVFGPTTVGASMIAFHGFDLVVHRWDIATAAGLDERLTDDELDMVDRSADGFGDHLYGEGVCKPAVPVDGDADRQERVLARLGRRTPSRA